MKALILSGGTGSRLRPFTHSTAKQLLPVANKPVLVHCLENIRDAGVTEAAVVVGTHAAEISQVVGDGSAFGLDLTYLHQDRPLGLAHCVQLASDFLGDDDFVMYLADNVLADGIVDAADAFAADRADALLLVQPVADPRAYGVAEIGADGRVHRLVEKPADPASDLAALGVYFFTSRIHRAVAGLRPSARGELEITDAIQRLADEGALVRAERYDGYWKDTGKAEDLLDCNRELLGRLTGPAVHGEVDAASTLSGPVVIEPGARVRGSRLVGPLVIAAGTTVTDCTVGPYVSVGRDCVLRDAAVADSILLEGAVVDGVPALDRSIIGRWARIGRSTAARHQLFVGDHANAEVAA
ncbi:glucose-1-phosphate thymidylyltransferase [Streptomyces yokosukanensis]|uniref:Glucose-1-phosphate thymidylyltransferase n=1 Tax=Streptomyces yokosukanensis TaxID=67386 RepID=A0A101NW88_9ACTN|nr:glucose-1-phosphate thymidylyltransferase [Streptomyces yokosukanensis]KUN00425.1 glucose-1-phosphate thymidylyltransferase [Streptomyces yokosukanensis]